MLSSLEKSLYGMLVTKAPFQIPANGRKAIVKYLPWLALVVGVVSVLGALAVYNAAMILTSFAGYAATYGVVQNAAAMAWVGILMLLAEAVIYFMAFPKLKKGEKAGWNLLFIGALLNLLYAVVTLVLSMDISGLLWNLIVSLVGLYFLFQIRDEYMGGKKPATPAAPTATPSAK